MKNLSVAFFGRDGVSRQQAPAGVTLSVKRLRWHMTGGPAECEIEATGFISARWELAEMLRYGVEVLDAHGEAVWWGYVSRVEINDNRVSTALDIETMYNAVRARYQLASGETSSSEVTAWATDSVSGGLYGLKGTEISLGDETRAGAEVKRNRVLEQQRLPLPEVTTQGGGQAEPTATLRAVGWWTVLDWGYYFNLSGKELYDKIGNGLQAFGNAAGTEKVGQSFKLSSAAGWNASSVRVRLKKEGSPADNILIEICANAGGAPGTVLASATRPASELPVNLNWMEFTLGAPVSLATGTFYWVRISRSGALDGANYYKIDANEEVGYSNGSFAIWNGSAWVSRSPDASMLFQVVGSEDTGTIIGAVVNFIRLNQPVPLAGCYVEQTSGATASPYQEGEKTGAAVVDDALALGAAGGLAYLATVERGRMVRLRRENVADAWYMTTDGRPREKGLNPLSLRQIGAIAGTWGRLVNVIPANVDTRRVTGLGRVFAEEVEYDPERDEVTIRARGMATLTDQGL